MGATPSTLTREELKTAVDELTDEIVNGTDEHWQRYATQLSAERALGAKLGLFKPWSVNNMFNLHAQVLRRGESVKGLYAGVDQWRKRGRTVRDGEAPYFIYGAPSFVVKDKNAQQPANAAPATTPGSQSKAQPAPAPAVAGTRMFRRPPIIEVFDWTQTVADDPDYVEPDWGVPLAVGDLDTLYQLAKSSPVPVKFIDIAARNEHGWLDASGISIDSSMPVGNRIFTALHELAHHYLGHLDQVNSTSIPVADKDTDEFSTYASCEQEAALAQFLAMKMLGLDEAVGNAVTQAAGAYLRSWMRTDSSGKKVPVEGYTTKRKLVMKRFDAAFKAADKIVSAYLECENPTSPVTA